MQAYHIKYTLKGSEVVHSALVDAKSLKYAKNKLMRKHNVKRLTIIEARVIGYF